MIQQTNSKLPLLCLMLFSDYEFVYQRVGLTESLIGNPVFGYLDMLIATYLVEACIHPFLFLQLVIFIADNRYRENRMSGIFFGPTPIIQSPRA